MQGLPHSKAWRYAYSTRVDRCHWCLKPFSIGFPPTFDHVIPRAAGGNLYDGWVLACALCNGARGPAPFGEYARIVRWERILSFLEDRPFRRPKFRNGGRRDQPVITTLPSREWRHLTAWGTGGLRPWPVEQTAS